MSIPRRGFSAQPISTAQLEARKRTTQIRAAGRKGKTATEIADLYQVPLRMVQHILTPVSDVRVSDPAYLLKTRAAAPGFAPADVQVYWVGFLTAAGHIWGQGTSSTLVMTLGDKSQAHVKTFMADLVDPHVRCEFCESNVRGWQVYLRNQSLCQALIPWGIPSDLFGEDPALLDDLPKEFVGPFLRGYLDGNWPLPAASPDRRPGGLVLHGTDGILSGINAMLRRCWGIDGGILTPRPPRADLRFPDRLDDRKIADRVNAYTTRARVTA